MVRTAQRLVIIVAFVASIIGYLYQAPNSEGIAQFSRVRTLGATMKLTQLIVCYISFILLDKIGQFCREQQPNYWVCLIVF
jgi:hypothetical protein